MSVLEIKEKLAEFIKNSDDQELLQEVYEMVYSGSPPYLTSDIQKLKLKNAKDEIGQGMAATHDEVKKRTQEWLKG